MSGAGEQLLVGLIALALVIAIGLRIRTGLRSGTLPIYRTRFARKDDPVRFHVLLALHIATFLIVALIAADLLLGLELRD